MYQIVSDRPQNSFSDMIADILAEEGKHEKESILVAVYLPADGDRTPSVFHNCGNAYELQDALSVLQDCVGDLRTQAAVGRALRFYGVIDDEDDAIEEEDDADE